MSRSDLGLLRTYGVDRRGRTAYERNERVPLYPQTQFDNARRRRRSGTPTLPTPALPTIAGLTLRVDFDPASLSEGAFPTNLAPRAGADTSSLMTRTGGVTIGTIGDERYRAFIFNGTDGFINIAGAFTSLNVANAAFTMALVYRRNSTASTEALMDISSSSASTSATINRYGVILDSAGQSLRRADNTAQSDAVLAGASTALSIILLTTQQSGANTIRGMHNAGTKVTSAARSVTQATWDRFTIGARAVSGTRQQFYAGAVMRVALWAGTASDADLDTLHAALAARYK